MKKKKKFKKKGVSPLVATILLVGFTVALIALIAIWGKRYVEEKAEKEGILAERKAECQNIEIEFVSGCKVGVEDGISYYNLTLKNKKPRKIEAFIMIAKAKGISRPVEKRKLLKGLSTREINVGFPIEKDISTIDIVPQLKAGRDVYVPCSQKHVEIRADLLDLCEEE